MRSLKYLNDECRSSLREKGADHLRTHSVEISWFFYHFLREINFGEFRSAKSAIWTDLEALNFDFYAFLHILKAYHYQIDKIQKK